MSLSSSDVDFFNPAIIAHASHRYPEAPASETCRCAAGCREIIPVTDRLCLDCAEQIVEVADEEHETGCRCLGCAIWSTASETLGGTALMWARRAVA